MGDALGGELGDAAGRIVGMSTGARDDCSSGDDDGIVTGARDDRGSGSNDVSQEAPVVEPMQLQEYPSSVFSHVPPFRHGSEAHKSCQFSQSYPKTTGGHEHRKKPL